MTNPKNKRLGEILIDKDLLLPELLDAALERQKQTGRRLGQVLLDMGFVSHEEVMNAVSDVRGPKEDFDIGHG